MSTSGPDQAEDEAPEPLTEEERQLVKKMLADEEAKAPQRKKLLSSTFIDRMTSSMADPDWIRRAKPTDTGAPAKFK